MPAKPDPHLRARTPAVAAPDACVLPGMESAEASGDSVQARRTQDVLQAAVAIFSSQGFAAADVQEIADRAGVGKGTVYRRFGSKEGLFLATVEHAKQWMLREVNQAADAACDPLQQMRLGVYAFITFFDEHAEVVELLIQERAHFRGKQPPTFFDPRRKENDKWIALFERLVREGVLRDLPVTHIQEAISRFVFGTMFINYFAGRDKPLAQQCEELFDVLFHGLLAERPQA